MGEPKITTHALSSNGWFSAEINGQPVTGFNGGLLVFPTRKEAHENAEAFIRSNPTAVFKE